MVKTLVETLRPEYYKDFSCIGKECEDTCCAGWKVDIDEESYKKYKRVTDYEMRQRLGGNLSRIRSQSSKVRYAKMKLNNDKCGFLTEEGLCDIQTNLGENYLCNTCYTYPRIFSEVNGVPEKSLTISCPEAARIILLNQQGIEFERTYEAKETRNISIGKIDADSKRVKKWQDYFWELRIFTITVLQNRKYTMEERLLILGLFYQKLEDIVMEKKIKEIPKLIGQYMNYLDSNAFENVFNDVPILIEMQLEFCKELIDWKAKDGLKSVRYIECLQKMLEGLNFVEGVSLEENKVNYESGYKKFYKEFMNEHSYILENYLVNYVFKNCMPIDHNLSPFESYIRMILHYSLIKVHLVGMGNKDKGLTIDLVIILFQSISKTFEHNTIYFRNIMSLMKENKYTTLSHMAILIKN